MLKRILTVIVLSCFLPVMAHAANWSLTTWARTSGGTIQVESGAVRTNLQGQLTTTFDYATTPAATVTVAPNTGYVVSQVILNGVTLTNPTQTTFDVSGPTAQSVQVYFALQKFSITSSVAGNTGGTVSPLSITGLTYNVALTVAKTVTFTPTSAVFTLSSITGIPIGVTPAAYQTPAVPVAGQAVKVTFPVGFKFTSDVVLFGTFNSLNPVANAGGPQKSFAGATVTLNGNGSQTFGGVSIYSYLWSQTAGPAVTLSNATAAVANFIPTVAGTYAFSLKLMPGGSTASTTVTVYESLPALIRNQCYDCHSAAGIGVATNVFGNWSSSGHKNKGVVCAQCHVGADTGGHPGLIRSGSVSTSTFNYTGSAGSGNFCVTCHNPAIVTDFAASKHSVRAGTASCSFCHVGGVHNPIAACIDCHNPGNTHGLTWPPTGLEFHTVYTGTNRCTECHNQHSGVASGCDGCHGAPPATASHLKHFGGAVSQAGYGDLRITQNFTANATGYIIGCGNCHPMDFTKHRNGVVDIELHNPLATAGSLKALNPATASYLAGPQVITDNKGIPYTEGTCNNVYCHSYNDWTTIAAIPADDPNWQDKVVVTRIYKSATWGGAALGCSGCHGNPTQTSSPTNDGGAGDSHAWIDSYGYGNLHTYNMAADPVSCSYCHNDTVKQKNTFTRNNMDVTVLGDVPISNFSKHVNGSNDVAFDTQKPFVYYSSSSHVSMSLAGATYAPATKTCSNVSCHFKETSVKWGTPYRWGYDNCDKCHGYSRGY